METRALGHARGRRFLFLGLILVVLGIGRSEAALAIGTSQTGPTLGAGRMWFTPTRLLDGRILIVGGDTSGVSSVTAHAELLDPSTGLCTPVGDLNVPRMAHRATLLDDGRVLITGGCTGDGGTQSIHATAEIYDPNTQTFTLLSDTMSSRRRHHEAVKLANGLVLIISGESVDGAGSWYNHDCTPTCDLFDPATNTFSLAGNLTYARHTHTATLLPDGHSVLIVGGIYRATFEFRHDAEIFDLDAGIRTAGQLSTTRYFGTSSLLPDGRVLVAGGRSSSELASTEIWDPATETFSPGPSMAHPRMLASQIVLPGGRVLIAGGLIDTPSTTLASTEVFDPFLQEFLEGPTLLFARARHGLTLLGTGCVLVTGGSQMQLNPVFLPTSTEVLCGIANAMPIASAGQDLVIEATSSSGATVTLDGSSSYDPDRDPLDFEWAAAEIEFDDATSATPTATFPIGPHLVTLTVADGKGGIDTDEVCVTVVDTTPPVLVCTISRSVLWPPNHKMVPVDILVVCSDAVSSPGCLLVSCTASSSEPDAGTGAGSTTGDVDGQDGYTSPVDVELEYDEGLGAFVGSVRLRAEREGSSSGRVYSIVCQVVDASGNASSATCVVVVPHDKRKR